MVKVGLMHNDLLTTAETAELLGVTPSAVSRMVARDELTPQLKGPGRRGLMLFHRTDVSKLLEQRKATKASS